MSNNYSPFAMNTLVTFRTDGETRLGLVINHSLDPNRRPGIGRVTYRVRPCTVSGGKAEVWGDRLRLVTVKAASARLVSVAEAAQLLASGEAKGWK